MLRSAGASDLDQYPVDRCVISARSVAQKETHKCDLLQSIRGNYRLVGLQDCPKDGRAWSGGCRDQPCWCSTRPYCEISHGHP